MVTDYGKLILCYYQGVISKGTILMAKCESCGKTTTFGHNRSFSMNATNRKFKANLHKVSIYENGKKVRKVLCTKCIKSLSKVK
jgi:large subunit ribosomal protein L28